jgi:hypothetical protein
LPVVVKVALVVEALAGLLLIPRQAALEEPQGLRPELVVSEMVVLEQ